MGLQNSRPLPQANAELEIHAPLKQRFRTWHIDHVGLVVARYRLLTKRFCVDALQLGHMLGIRDQQFVDDLVQLFAPRTPTRVQLMVDAMEVIVALVLVCQAPSMLSRFQVIFDLMDLNQSGAISTADVVVLVGAVGRSIMKIFDYCVAPDTQLVRAFVQDVLRSAPFHDDRVRRNDLCKAMLSNRFAVHYVKLCTGEDKPKLYVMLEKASSFIGAIEFTTEDEMRGVTLKRVRELIHEQLYLPPDDFAFLSHGKEIKRVWEVDKKAWSTVPFALRGSPGLRMQALARNRRQECPYTRNVFEFHHMGNRLPRYKDKVARISPVYKHRAHRLDPTCGDQQLHPRVQWRVASNWSGEWIYDQAAIVARTKARVQKLVRRAKKPTGSDVVVKSHHGELISPWTTDVQGETNDQQDENGGAVVAALPSAQTAVPPSAKVASNPTKGTKRPRSQIVSKEVRKHDAEMRQHKVHLQARFIAMDTLQRIEEKEASRHKEDDVRQAVYAVNAAIAHTTVLVRVDDDAALPSRLVPLSKRRSTKKTTQRTQQQRRWRQIKPTPPTPSVKTTSSANKPPTGSRRSAPATVSEERPLSTKSMKVSVMTTKVVLDPPAVVTRGRVQLGRFLVSSSIALDDDDVEVFPVIHIRPIEHMLRIGGDAHQRELIVPEPAVDVDAQVSPPPTPPLALHHVFLASRSYLSACEWAMSATESNYEAVFDYVGGVMDDAITLNRQDVLGRTVLHDAAEHGHGSVMELLLQAKVLMNVPDSHGDTPLHHAARRGRLKEVSYLLKDGTALWARNIEGKTPLYCALETAAKLHDKRLTKTHAVSSSATSLYQSSANNGNHASATHRTKNFFFADQAYTKLRQVIDLLWDHAPPHELLARDAHGHANCLEIETRVYGDLLQASREGNLARVQRLLDLDKRAPPLYINTPLSELGRTALHEAAEEGHTAIVDLLIKVGADARLVDQQHRTPLHVAAAKGHTKILHCLTARFAHMLGETDASGRTALHEAVAHGHWGSALHLIAAIKQSETALPSLNSQDSIGLTALHYACAAGQEDVCVALLDAGAAPAISRFGRPASHAFALATHWERWHQSRGGASGTPARSHAKKQISTPVDIDSPLELVLKGCRRSSARFADYLSIVRLLLTAIKAQPQPHPLTKKTPEPLYHLAAAIAPVNMSVAVETCRQLHRCLCEINIVHARTGETALLLECKRLGQAMQAQRQRTPSTDDDDDKTTKAQLILTDEDEQATQLALVRALIELGANVNLHNDVNGETPLGCAAWSGHLPLLHLLLEAGADRDFYARQSFTPLHFAALGGHVACAAMLVSSSAIVNVEMPPGNAETPLFFAIRSQNVSLVELLLRGGANATALCSLQHNVRTSFGTTLCARNQGLRRLHQIAVPRMGSPLTLALLLAVEWAPFIAVEDIYEGGELARRHARLAAFQSIAMLLATHAMADGTVGSAATPTDVELACRAGLWDVAKLLLTQRVRLPGVSSVTTYAPLHLAAMAGQTDVVVALVTAGANVNCIVQPAPTKQSQQRKKPPKGKLQHKAGALLFALINGHIATAAKLLVLGANPLETLPHAVKSVRKRLSLLGKSVFVKEDKVVLFVAEALPRIVKAELMSRQHGREGAYVADAAVVHFVRHLEWSLNEGVPLLHLETCLGHTTLARLLVQAGMNAFQSVSFTPAHPGASGEQQVLTPVNLAIECGHKDLLEMYAALVHNDLPHCFVRDTKKPKSLLVSACHAQRLDMLTYLLTTGEGHGGGFSLENARDDLQKALDAAARYLFYDGFQLLVQHGATPSLSTLVAVLSSISTVCKHQPARATMDASIKSPTSPSGSAGSALATLRAVSKAVQPRFVHDRLPDVERLVRAIIPFARDQLDEFLGVPSFDPLLQLLITAAQYSFWFLLDDLLVANRQALLQPASAVKPLLLRAASCCLVLHRAVMSNQVAIVNFLLDLGVPADLRLSELPRVHSPIWYAATCGCLASFLALALRSPECVAALAGPDKQRIPAVFRRSTDSLSFLSPQSKCQWQNVAAMSCYALPRSRLHWALIRKFIHYHTVKQAPGDTLLHVACRRGELIAVQALIQAGAELYATNGQGETPLMAASRRRDAMGVIIVRYVVTTMQEQGKSTSLLVSMLNRALLACCTQSPPGSVAIATILLDAGAVATYTEGEQRSSLSHALQWAQLPLAVALLTRGAVWSSDLIRDFLEPFAATTVVWTSATQWKQHAWLMQGRGKRLHDLVGLMRLVAIEPLLLETPDLVHVLIATAAALAATIARKVDMDQHFWDVVLLVVEHCGSALRGQSALWGVKTALHHAVAALELNVATKLLTQGGFAAHAVDDTGETPLHIVARSGDAAICSALLEQLVLAGGSALLALNSRNRLGRTPLHLAAMHGHDRVAQLLVDAGAAMDCTCNHGWTPLLLAAKSDHLVVLVQLFTHAQANRSTLLCQPSGEAGVFLAAKHGAARVVRWFITIFEDDAAASASQTIWQLRCRRGRTLCHYTAMWGDDTTIRLLLDKAASDRCACVNVCDDDGYTPAMYAFALGRLAVFQLLIEAGADVRVVVDHTGDATAHPYAATFTLATLTKWFALPGWLTLASTTFPVRPKRSLVQDTLVGNDFFMNASYRIRKDRRCATPGTASKLQRAMAYRCQRKHNHGVIQATKKPKSCAVERVRTSLRTWAFARTSLLDFACAVDDVALLELVLRVLLPVQSAGALTYRQQRRIFLQAVQWDRVQVVERLLTAAKASPQPPSQLHFIKFIETAIDIAVNRGLEQMTMTLLAHWRGLKEHMGDSSNSDGADDAAAFAFQFAHTFQTACLRNMVVLVEYMLVRGDHHIVAFQWNDGSALLYAVAFGHIRICSLLQQHGAKFSASDELVAPSVKKWHELGCPQQVSLTWARSRIERRNSRQVTVQRLHKQKFVGPLELYDPNDEWLPSEMMIQLFSSPSSVQPQVAGDNEETAPSNS